MVGAARIVNEGWTRPLAWAMHGGPLKLGDNGTMILPPDDEDQPIEAAVAVVGAGPAGMSLALALGRAGVSTVVIESGGERLDPWSTALSHAAAIDPPGHARLDQSTNRRLGGSSWTWGGRCVDFEPLDFERPHAEAPGWPISHAEAIAEAGEAAVFFGIGAPRFDAPFAWTRPGDSLTARLERWCADPRLARARAADLRASPARFHTGLTCTGVALSADGGEVTGLRVMTCSGKARQVKARHYVLALGGIETTRLLLASNDVAPAGIGNGSGWVGRGYMGHLQGHVADIVLDGLGEMDVDYVRDGAAYARPRLTLTPETLREHGLLNISFLADNPLLGDWRHRSSALSAAALALGTPGVGRRLVPGPIRDILLGGPLTRDGARRHLGNIAADPLGAVGFAAGYLASRLAKPRPPGMFVRNPARRYALRYYAEHSPIRASQVRLSGERDALGTPRVIVDKRVADLDVESVLAAHDLFDAALRRRGLAALEFLSPSRAERSAVVAEGAADGFHQIGLARMGDDPASSVVDRNCRVHGIGNLHLAGSAVFPTSGQANPTFMIVCLALRLAKRLAAEA